jgi:hypothetical protein
MKAAIPPIADRALELATGGGRSTIRAVARDRYCSLDELKLREMPKPVVADDELSETGDALRYMGEGHARGKVVITVGNA